MPPLWSRGMQSRHHSPHCRPYATGLVAAVLLVSSPHLSAHDENPAAAKSVDSADAIHSRLHRHVRPLDPIAEWLVQAGTAYSPTFRRMLDGVEQSDVVAYVMVDSTLPQWLGGTISFVGTTAGVRYVRIAVRPGDDASRRIVMLGHELTHAIEIASTPSIQDSDSMADAYRSRGAVGVRHGKAVVDTWAAGAMATEIDRDLQSRRSLLALELEGRERTLRRSARNSAGAHDIHLSGNAEGISRRDGARRRDPAR
jgi:hypothetical protein